MPCNTTKNTERQNILWISDLRVVPDAGSLTFFKVITVDFLLLHTYCCLLSMIIRINSRCIVFGVVAILILFNVYLWHVPVKTRNDELILSSLNDTLLVVNKELVAIHNKLLEKKAIVSTSAIAKPPPVDSIDKPEKRSITQKKRAVLFTMDSIESYEQNSLSGGAAGKLLSCFSVL